MKTHLSHRGLSDGPVLQEDNPKSPKDSGPDLVGPGEPTPPLKSSFRFAIFWFGLPVLVLVLMAYLERRP